MKITDFKAKSDGTLLIEHSKNVSYVAVKIAELSNIKEQYKEPIRLGGLLHDIGKACSAFQDLISNPYKDYELKKKQIYRHNEIGWAFLKMYSKFPDIVNKSVYWHHGISNKMGGYSIGNVMDDISDYDKESMLWVLETLVGHDNIREKDVSMVSSPTYFDPIVGDGCDTNPDNLIIRSCIIAADHFVSSLGKTEITDEKIKKYYDNVILKNNNEKYDFSHNYNNDRTIKQIEISEKENKTIIVKAPAGFGKTLTGIMWNMKSDRKLIWVCPRNVIAESVYRSILSEISNVEENKLTIELYLSGEVQESHNHKSSGFESDIIVTNIDSFLKPSFDLSNSDKIIQILNCDIVFDEFHEFQTQVALFACFVNMMKVRTSLDCRTMLLSATPSIMYFLWDGINSTNTILPNDKEHYPAAHDKVYTLHVLKNNDIEHIKQNSLIMFNAINRCQEVKKVISESILIHSKYEKEHRKNIMDEILSIYGKNIETKKTKLPLISAPVLQAGLDISVSELYESMISPESTLQRIGRINRWGEIGSCELYIHDMSKDSGERACINNFYNMDLMKLWFDVLKEFDGKSLTLKEIYEIYNKFNIDNNNNLKKHIRSQYYKSLNDYLVKCVYPFKFNESLSKSDIKIAGSNKLRNSGLEVFYIVKKSDGTYTEPFSKKVEGGKFDESFNETGIKNIEGSIMAEMKKIQESGDNRFDFSKILSKYNKITIDGIRRYAQKSNTPYIMINGRYDDILGIIKK